MKNKSQERPRLIEALFFAGRVHICGSYFTLLIPVGVFYNAGKECLLGQDAPVANEQGADYKVVLAGCLRYESTTVNSEN